MPKSRVTKLIFANQYGPKVLLRTREGGAHWRVEIQPAVDVQKKRRVLSSALDEAKRVIKKYPPYDYDCRGGFDTFGDWYAVSHDENCCREGVPVNKDKDDDWRVFNCDVELRERYKLRLKELERLGDFMDCFKSPLAAMSLFPLTTGRAMTSCIHDNV